MMIDRDTFDRSQVILPHLSRCQPLLGACCATAEYQCRGNTAQAPWRFLPA